MQIHPVPRPATRDADPHPLVHAAVHVEDAVEFDQYGHHDFADTARSRTVRLFGSEQSESHLWVALPDGVDPDTCAPEEGLAMASVRLPLLEDTDKADVHVVTHPAHRSQGHAKALMSEATHLLHERGRRTWIAYAFSPGPEATGPDAVPARTGSGAVDGRRPAHRWLQAEGFTLEQCERPSTLVLDDVAFARAEELAAGARRAAPAASGYELLSWSDATPAGHLDGMAWLVSRMSTDVPNGDLGFDEQVWDAERLLAGEERVRAAGIHWVLTAARHRGTGQLVAFTRFEWPEENPAGVWQEETLVLAEHRGHRLGTLVKAANLPRLLEVNPAARRVHTWNAAENRWMLAINDALGFVPVGLEGAWQKKL